MRVGGFLIWVMKNSKVGITSSMLGIRRIFIDWIRNESQLMKMVNRFLCLVMLNAMAVSWQASDSHVHQKVLELVRAMTVEGITMQT